MITADGLPDNLEECRFYRLIERRWVDEDGWVSVALACGHRGVSFRKLPPGWKYAPCGLCVTDWFSGLQHIERDKLDEWHEERVRLCENT